MRNEKVSYTIRILVAAYLVYTAYQLIQHVMGGESENPVLFTAAGVVFVAFAVVFALSGLRGLKRLSREGQDPQQDPQGETEYGQTENVDEIGIDEPDIDEPETHEIHEMHEMHGNEEQENVPDENQQS